MAREPGYCFHKPTNQAYVRLGGQVFYLGAYGSDKSRERYNALKSEWLLNRHTFEAKKVKSGGPCMADLCLAYLDHAAEYYKTGNEYDSLKSAIKPVSELYATTATKDFSPTEYLVVRQWWLNRKTNKGVGVCSRKTINEQMKRLMRIFKWGVSQGLVPVTVYQTLKCIDPLKKGRSTAREPEPVKPVSDSVVEKTLEHCTGVVADMIRFQLLVGCRPGEVCAITPSMVDRSQDVWVIKLDHHKTAHHGKERHIYVGPKAQAILAKYLLRAGDKPCFSPIESEQQRREAKHAARRTPLSCGNVPGSNRVGRKPRRAPGEAFTAGTYGRSIKSACLRAKVEPWSPNQLRHATATAVRKTFGLEAAQLVLGHSSADVTQIYAERDIEKGIEIARKIG